MAAFFIAKYLLIKFLSSIINFDILSQKLKFVLNHCMKPLGVLRRTPEGRP